MENKKNADESGSIEKRDLDAIKNSSGVKSPLSSFAHTFILPVLLFAAIGGFGWTVRGESGFGAVQGCVFAGVGWGTAWYFLSRGKSRNYPRRYSSGWAILALTIGIGLGGMHGWMQWPSWFVGKLYTNSATQQYVPIDPIYGYIWYFIAGMPWAGLGAVFLAWTGSKKPLKLKDWIIRIIFGAGGGLIALGLFYAFPSFFLPFYNTLDYSNAVLNPNLIRVFGDNRTALLWMGLYLGFLCYEIIRKDWRNVKLIATVGLITGFFWAIFQTWQFSYTLWPTANFNFWRCWETSGGISIGISLGFAFYFVNKPLNKNDLEKWVQPYSKKPHMENLFGVYFAIIIALTWNIKCGIIGSINSLGGDENYWDPIISPIAIVLGLLLFLIVFLKMHKHKIPQNYEGQLVPNYLRYFIIIIIIQHIIGFAITQPLTSWIAVSYNIYYVLLFVIIIMIVYHYIIMQKYEEKLISR